MERTGHPAPGVAGQPFEAGLGATSQILVLSEVELEQLEAGRCVSSQRRPGGRPDSDRFHAASPSPSTRVVVRPSDRVRCRSLQMTRAARMRPP